jgi:hypothetical protein
VPKKLHRLFFLLLLIFGLIKTSFGQSNTSVVNLNFGKVKPVASVIHNQKIPAAFATEKVNGMQIEVAELLSGTTAKHRLPANRMRLLLGDRAFQLSSSVINIGFDQLISKTALNNLGLELKLMPEDHSDLYTGTILFKTWVDCNGVKKWQSALEVKLTVEIQPWLKIQTDSDPVFLEPVNYTDFGLANLRPLRIRIAANTSWLLGCKLSDSVGGPRMTVKIPTGQSGLQILNQNLAVTTERQNLAAGTAPTAVGSYWREILLVIAINDFRIYPSREYTIPLEFTLLSWDGKNAIP